MRYLYIFLILSLNCVYGDEFGIDYEIPHLVHFKKDSLFCVEFIEFMDNPSQDLPEANRKNRPRFGDIMLIKDLKKEILSEGSYRYVAVLQNLRNGLEEVFQSRIVATAKQMKVAKVLGLDKTKADKTLFVRLENGETLPITIYSKKPWKVYMRDDGTVDDSEFQEMKKDVEQFEIHKGDLLEIAEDCHYFHKNHPGNNFFYDISISRNGEVLPFKGYSGWMISRKPFPSPTNNRFLASYDNNRWLHLSGMYREWGYEILDPEWAEKTLKGWITFISVENEIFLFMDENGNELHLKVRPKPEFSGRVGHG